MLNLRKSAIIKTVPEIASYQIDESRLLVFTTPNQLTEITTKIYKNQPPKCLNREREREEPDLIERSNISFELVDLLGIGGAESSSSHFRRINDHSVYDSRRSVGEKKLVEKSR